MIRATTAVDALLFTTAARLAKLQKPFKRAGFGAELRTAEAEEVLAG